jgi:hypothetical protein
MLVDTELDVEPDGDVTKILFTACLPNEDPAPNINPSDTDCTSPFDLLNVFIVLLFKGSGGDCLLDAIIFTSIYTINIG